jgi:hypothetical protein
MEYAMGCGKLEETSMAVAMRNHPTPPGDVLVTGLVNLSGVLTNASNKDVTRKEFKKRTQLTIRAVG